MQFVALTVICHLGFCFASTSQRNCVSAVRRLDALPQKTYILLILDLLSGEKPLVLSVPDKSNGRQYCKIFRQGCASHRLDAFINLLRLYAFPYVIPPCTIYIPPLFLSKPIYKKILINSINYFYILVASLYTSI